MDNIMGRILGAFIYIKHCSKEPSTYASVSAVSAMLGVQVDAGLVQDVLNVSTLVFGGLGFFIREQAPLTKVE